MADTTINGLQVELVTPNANDLVGIWDVAAGQYKKIKRSNLVGVNVIGGGTIDTGGFTLAVPASMTAAGRDVANSFTAAQTVVGASVGATLAASGNGRAVRHVGITRTTTMSVANNQTFTFTFDGDGCLFIVELGYAAVFFADGPSSTIVELADPDTIAPAYIAVTKSAGSNLVSVKNQSGSTRLMSVLALGAITAFTNPT